MIREKKILLIVKQDFIRHTYYVTKVYGEIDGEMQNKNLFSRRFASLSSLIVLNSSKLKFLLSELLASSDKAPDNLSLVYLQNI